MTPQDFLTDLETFVETSDVECKAAQGRDGRGELPASIWETYSAMANSAGGDIYLGVEETPDHRFICKGIQNIQKIRKAVWDNLNSKAQVNKNILQLSDVIAIDEQGKSILQIRIPRARRQDRPIHLKENPFGNTFLRRHEGDYRADEETVRRMLAEAVEDSTHTQTLIELRTISLLPNESVQNLRKLFGDGFQSLSELQRIALITAETEGFVSHSRMKSLSTAHSSDLSSMLTGLVKDGFLEKEGETRACVYFVKGSRPYDLFTQEIVTNSPDLLSNSPDLTPNSPDLKELLQKLLAKIGHDQMPAKLQAEKMKILIKGLCNARWLSLSDLSTLLFRDNKALQDQYLTQMIAEGALQLKFPETKNHPAQAYRTAP